jgi:hypothetical protein
MWNLASSNKICSEKNLQREHMLHSLKLSQVKPAIDNKQPTIIPHERFRARKERIFNDRMLSIQQDNRILLQKMLRIDSRPSFLSPTSIQQSRPPSAGSLNITVRMKELNKITDENRRILGRLQKIRSNYSIKKWRNDYMQSQYLSTKLSENSGRVPKSTTYSPVSYDAFSLAFPKARVSRPISADEVARFNLRSGRSQTANTGMRRGSKIL